MNYSNYGRSLELVKFQQINEAQIGHASDNSVIGFDKLMGGEKGSPYTSNYNQLVDKIGQAVDKGEKKGTVEIMHDDNSHFLTITYEIDYTDPNQAVVSLYRSAFGTKAGAAKPSAGAASGAATGTMKVSEKIDMAAMNLAIALASGINEDENAVYNVFEKQITNDADLNQLLKYWQSLKLYVPEGGMLFGAFGGAIAGINKNDWNEVKAKYADPKNKSSISRPTDPNQYTLQYWLNAPDNRKDSGGDLLHKREEMTKLNSIIKRYSSFQFKIYR